MLSRCYRRTDASFCHYGARGIAVCGAWTSYQCFAQWAVRAGYYVGLSLDRRDNNGDYSPTNCRWATSAQQNRNRRNNKLSERQVKDLRRARLGGASQRALARRFNISRTLVRNILGDKAWHLQEEQ